MNMATDYSLVKDSGVTYFPISSKSAHSQCESRLSALKFQMVFFEYLTIFDNIWIFLSFAIFNI